MPDLSSRSALRNRDRIADVRENPRHLGHKSPSGIGELHPVAGTVEQGHAHLGFEGLDLLGQRGLGDIQALGCAGEIQLLGDRQEVP